MADNEKAGTAQMHRTRRDFHRSTDYPLLGSATMQYIPEQFALSEQSGTLGVWGLAPSQTDTSIERCRFFWFILFLYFKAWLSPRRT